MLSPLIVGGLTHAQLANAAAHGLYIDPSLIVYWAPASARWS
jgi:hypothetical protein